MSFFRFALLALLVVSVAACDTNEPDERADIALYVGNQGNFSDNNGSLTRYDLDTETVMQDAIPNLGGLVQNLYGGGNTLYVLLNFSDSFSNGTGRIDVVDAITRQRTDQIDVSVPRSLAIRSASQLSVRVFATNLYDNTVTPIDLVSGVVGTPIAVGNNPEGAVDAGVRTYIANSGFGSGSSLTVLSTASGDVLETIDNVCAGPRTLLRDGDGDVWVICSGTSDFTTGAVTAPGEIVVLAGATGEEKTRFTYDGETLGSATFGRDGIYAPGPNASSQEVYVIAGASVLRFDSRSNTLDARIAVSGAPIGAVEYDPRDERLYLARPDASNPFTVDGEVTIHDRTGALTSRFPAGIAPSVFAFVTESATLDR